MRKIKHILLFVLSVLFFAACNIDNSNNNDKNNMNENISTKYDSVQAQKYGADQYGMKKYVMAFLKKGTNRNLEPEKAKELQREHLINIDRLAEEGKLVLAGPFLDDGNVRGIYIFNVESIEEAQKLTLTDPAIKANSLEMELHEWYGSAALMAVNKIHNTLSKKEIVEE